MSPIIREPQSSTSRGSAGVQFIPITTPVGTFKVWIRKVGDNAHVKILLLHGGPAFTTEYFESFEPYLVDDKGYELYYYHQLGSYLSDQPGTEHDDALWTPHRFVEEVEQVRKGLGINSENGYLVGNSWGGILCMEYATSKYGKNFKAIVISNMQSSFPEYAAYNNKLRSRIDPGVIALMEKYESKGDFLNPEYDTLVMKHYYSHHVCRILPFPDGVQRAMDHHNQHIYELMQGPSEFVPGGLLADWDITNKLSTITIPSLMVGAEHDTMDPEAMKKQASLVQKGRYLHCPNGSHMCMWDDQGIYFTGIIKFIEDVESGTF